jgi:hypothetical protein
MIIVSFTTIPERLEKGLPERCIKTLLAQDRPADIILLNIPRKSRKGHTYNKELTQSLEEEGVIINWVDKDYGPITKLFGTLDYIERHNIKEARIILADDDVEYKPWNFRKLIEEGGKAGGFVSRDPVLEWGRVKETVWLNKGSAPTAILETYAGVIYDASLFLPYASFKEWYLGLPSECHNADDIVISAWVQRQGVIPMRLSTTEDSYKHDSAGTTQLNEINNGQGNNTYVTQYMFDHFDFQHWQTLLSYIITILIRFWWLLVLICVAVVWYIQGPRMKRLSKRVRFSLK